MNQSIATTDKTAIKKESLDEFFREMDKEMDDVQGLIRRGYKSLPAAQFLLIKIDDGAEAKKYFSVLADSFITSSNKPESGAPPNSFDKTKSVQIAFTSTGLKCLGLKKETLATFSREFVEGMSFTYADPADPNKTIRERSTLLGDIGSNDPTLWHWGNESNRVDGVLLLYALSADLLNQLIADCFDNLKAGVSLVHRAETFAYDPREDIKEHFGFKDGISQPIIRGFKKSADKDISYDQLINPGEVILGHKNEYDNYSPSPWVSEPGADSNLDPLPGSKTKKNLGKNGSYLVFRQMEQHVDTFYDYVLRSSKETGATPEQKALKLAAKMIGRWPEGESLSVSPEPPTEPVKDLNRFLYFDADNDGTGCPFGAHVRRTNPRDQVHAGRGQSLSLEMSKKHRLLRRGRIYGEPITSDLQAASIIEKLKKEGFRNKWTPDPNSRTPIRRGIHFMCLVSDIGRQFEFVQSVWANTPSFAELGAETDPIISPRIRTTDGTCDQFTAPTALISNRYRKVPEFTTVVGGAYFFMPGIRALKYILK